MTNHENLSKLTGDTDSVEITAVKMLLERIREDIKGRCFKQNFDKYPEIYVAMKSWLNSKVDLRQELWETKK